MIFLICNYYEIYDNGVPTGSKELIVSHGVDSDTLRNVVLPQVSPMDLGAKRDNSGEWYLSDY